MYIAHMCIQRVAKWEDSYIIYLGTFLKRNLLQITFMWAVTQFNAPVEQSIATAKKLSDSTRDIEELLVEWQTVNTVCMTVL